jgi:hypothetical protein
MSPVLATRDIAIYAALVASFDLVWTLYAGAIRDRARIVVRVAEANMIPAVGASTPVFSVDVSNRGRRPTTIRSVSRVSRMTTGVMEMSADIAHQTPVRLEEGQSHTFHHGLLGGYAHGDLSLRRWFVTDGAGRVFPLRERYRQRVERVIFAPFRWWDRRRR